MARKWCQKETRYKRWKEIDDHGYPHYLSKKIKGGERDPTECLRETCCDAFGLMCIPNECTIFECNKNKWRPRRKKIHDKVEQLPRIINEFESLMEDYEGVDITNPDDADCYFFYAELFDIMNSWHPLQNGPDEIRLYYRERDELDD